MSFGNYIIIKFPDATPIISYRYFILTKSLLYNCTIYLVYITRTIMHSIVNNSKVKITI